MIFDIIREGNVRRKRKVNAESSFIYILAIIRTAVNLLKRRGDGPDTGEKTAKEMSSEVTEDALERMRKRPGREIKAKKKR